MPRLRQKGKPVKTSSRIRAIRESGQVQRLHTCPHIGDASVASHCFNAVSMLYVLNPAPSHNLVRALLWHDSAERWVGDVPGCTKVRYPELKALLDKIEDDYLERMRLTYQLSDDEAWWLKEMDMLELLLYTQDQMALGNRHIIPTYDDCVAWFHSHRGSLHQSVDDALVILETWHRVEHEEIPSKPQVAIFYAPKAEYHFQGCRCDLCVAHYTGVDK